MSDEKQQQSFVNLTSQLMQFLSKMEANSIGDLIDFLVTHRHKSRSYLNASIICPPNLLGTPLTIACWRLNLEAVRCLIRFGCDVNVRDLTDSTPLMHVLRMPEFGCNSVATRKDLIKLLIENGADVNTNDRRHCAIGLAAKGNDSEIVELLIKAKADVNALSVAGRTPLMLSSTPEIAQMLIRHGANVHAQDNSGQTALMYHVDKFEIMKILIDSGASIYHRDANGLCVLEHCIMSGANVETLLFLSKLCLHDIFVYFRDTNWNMIRKNLHEYVNNPKHEYLFPLKSEHLIGIDWLIKFWSTTKEKEFLHDFCFLRYFGSQDFQEKMCADIIFGLDENNFELDGQSLRGMRFRARSRHELDRISRLASLLGEKQTMAVEFYRLTEKLTKIINDINFIK